MSDEGDMPLEPEPEVDHLVTKTVTVHECMRISDGQKFLIIEQGEELTPWETHSLLWGADQIISAAFANIITTSPEVDEEGDTNGSGPFGSS